MTSRNDLVTWWQLGDFTGEQTVSFDTESTIVGLLAVYGFALVMMVLTRVLPSVLTVPFVVLALSFVPGALVLVVLMNDRLVVGAEQILYAFGTSLLLLMLTGVLVNILLPLVGVSRPLMPIPLAAGVTTAVSVLAVVAYQCSQTGTVTLRIPPLWAPVPLSLLLLPLLSIIGVNLLNATGVNVLLVVVLVVIAVVPLVAVSRLQDRWYPLAIWTIALAILYHKSLWQYAGFDGRPHGITAWEAGRWSPGVTSIEPYSSELVQNGVLFPMVAKLSDLFIMTQFEVVNPFFVSFIPLALYVTFREYVSTEMAFLGAATFAFVHPFYLQYPWGGRAATPVLFFALFGVTLSNDGLSPKRRAALGLSFLAGIVTTHYGTSYYVLAALLIAVVLLYSLWTVDRVSEPWFRRIDALPDGGKAAVGRVAEHRQPSLLSGATVSFFFSAALGWYLYTRQGWKFGLLPKHIYKNLRSLVSGPTVNGRTAARVQESYTALSIQISKQIYIGLALLTALGFAVVYVRRVLSRDDSFDDHYLTISTALFGIFGSTMILSNWGGGRPMMITFSFTTVFAVVGAVWLATAARRGVEVLSRSAPKVPDEIRNTVNRLSSGDAIGTHGFAVLLMLLLILNTGVAAATVFGGGAPSNVAAQSKIASNDAPRSQVTVHRPTDIETHVWLVRHFDPAYPVYGDTYGARQFDWYRPPVAAQTPAIGGGYTSDTKPELLSVAGQRTRTQPGYTLIMGHNIELKAVWLGKFSPPVPLDELELEHRNRIYTTGESHIYFYTAPETRTPDSGEG